MSTPSSPAANLARLASSSPMRRRPASNTSTHRLRGTTTTPSSSATIASPGWTSCPPQTTGTFTEPGLVLVVPCGLTARAHTGNPIAVSSAASRTPAAVTRPIAPWARREVARSSPIIPSVEIEVVVTTRMSPGSSNSTAAWTMRLSPGGHETVTAEPAIRAPVWIGRIAVSSAPRRWSASCTVDTPSTARPSITEASVRTMSRTTTWELTLQPPSCSCQLPGHLREDPLVRLGHDVVGQSKVRAGVTGRLGAPAAAELRVVRHKVRLRAHDLHGLAFAFPAFADVEQHIGHEPALFGLMRFEAEHRRGTDHVARRLHARRLRIDACPHGDRVRGPVVRVVRILRRMGQHDRGLDLAVQAHQLVDQLGRLHQRVVAAIVETDLRAERGRRALGLVAPVRLHLIQLIALEP